MHAGDVGMGMGFSYAEEMYLVIRGQLCVIDSSPSTFLWAPGSPRFVPQSPLPLMFSQFVLNGKKI